MTNDNRNERLKLERLADAVAQDIIDAPDDEIIKEAAEDYEDVDAIINNVQSVIGRAISFARKERLEAAKKAYSNDIPLRQTSVVRLDIDEKRQLIDRIRNSTDERVSGLTLAARKAEGQSENDLDSLLDDLFELGIIDEEGNLK